MYKDIMRNKEKMDLAASRVIERLVDLQSAYDGEESHLEADKLLCELLVQLGYYEVVDAWEKIERYYG